MELIGQAALLVITNLGDIDSARRLARALVEQRLAACVNLLPGVQSVYRWQGNIEEEGEVTLLIKTTEARYAELEAAIRALHPYELPELIALPVAAGLPAYLHWIRQETKKDSDV
jgi:periplasmic divalent cation tolerance protein